MATWYAQNSTVNIDSVNQWNSAANGSGSWLTWASLDAADILVMNGKTNVTINVSFTCAQLTNTVVSGSTTGGTLLITTGGITVTLSGLMFCITSAALITVSHASGTGTVNIVAGTFQSQNSSTNRVVLVSGTGACNVTGNIVTAVSFSTTTATVAFTGSGTNTFTGNVAAGYFGSNNPTTNIEGALLVSNGSVTVTGTITGTSSNFGWGLLVTGGSCTLVGTTIGGSGNSTVNGGGAGSCCYGGTLTIFGTAEGSGSNPGVTVDRNLSSTRGSLSGIVVIKGTMKSGTSGCLGSWHPNTRLDPTTECIATLQITGGSTTGSLRNMYTGGSQLGYPTQADVRSATVYGDEDEYTGTLAVPSPTLVAIGVSTDNTTGTYNPQPAILISTTIATLASQTSFTLTAGSADNDVYNGQTAIVTDASTSTQKAVATVLDYVGSTKTITLSADPAIFTMAIGDLITIIAGGGGSAPTASAIADEVQTRTIARVTLVDTLTTYTGNTVQTGDSFARIGVNGAGLTSLATAAQIAAMTVNTRVNYQVPIEIELPDASTQIFKIRLHLFDEEGNMESPDSTPTIALTNAAGTDRSSRLSVASNPSTGVYSWDYTATAGDAEEQLVWVFTVVEGTLTRTYPATSYVVEESAYRFSSTDRATLNAAATQASVNDVPTVAEFEARTLVAASYGTASAIAAEAVKTAAIKTKTDQLTFTTPNKVDSTAVLDSAAILAVADQVWDEAMSGHTTAGTYGGRIVRATNSNNEVQITGSHHIAADIHELQSGVITAGDFAANSLTASALATDAVTEIQSGLASQSSVDTLTSYVDTEVAAIKAKTDNLPSDPADASDIASSFSTVNTKLDTIDDFLDTEIAAIKAKTDNLPADPADQSLVEAAITAATSPLATPAQVNAEVVDVLSVDTFAELSAPPAATSSLKDKITWLFMYARNKVTQTALARTLYRDDTTTVAGTSATSDNGTTFTKGEDA